jgi:hypothetical protein
MAKFYDMLKALKKDCSPTCKEAARLQSLALDRKLSPLERFGLRVHLFLCKWCRCYGHQIGFLSSAAKTGPPDDLQPPPQALSPEARQRIKQALQSPPQ